MPSVVSTGRTVTRELLEAMRRTHPLEHAMATLLIQEGSWKIAGNDENGDDKYSVSAPGKARTRDTTRDCVDCGQLFAGKIH